MRDGFCGSVTVVEAFRSASATGDMVPINYRITFLLYDSWRKTC